jgi:hypothetical protein
VQFRLSNSGSREIRVVGATSTCFLHACLQADGFPLVIPAGGTREVRVDVIPKSPGEFEGTITLFTDARTIRELTLEIKGRITSAEGRAS